MNDDPTKPFVLLEEGIAYLAFIVLMVMAAVVV